MSSQAEKLQPRSCGFLIVRGNPFTEFLLMKHPDRWDLPKGHVDPGETDLQAALRELEEETAIRESDIELIDSFRFELRYPVSLKRYGRSGTGEKVLRIYLGRLVRDVEIVLTEHDGYQWFRWDEPHVQQKKTIDPLLEAVREFRADNPHI